LNPSTNIIRIGPAGWSYTDWQGIVYPVHKPRGFHEAAYLAEFFDTIEINTSFYQPLRPGLARAWVERVAFNKDFQFTAKLWNRFTHERENLKSEDEKIFKRGLAPLAEAGRLGALLVQFPWSFKNTPKDREYLESVCRRFRDYPLVVEVRHASWDQPEVREMLGELAVGFANIDQPVIGRSLRPSEHATAPVGYVRLHGRRYDQWFSSEGDPHERYNYLYRLSELEPWAERVKKVAESARVTFVIANNHFQGKAVTNALQLIALVEGRPVKAPETLIEHYPELAQVASLGTPPRQQKTLSLEFPPPDNKEH
jgi:uncharacterized protein YecE (DUF72 family)